MTSHSFKRCLVLTTILVATATSASAYAQEEAGAAEPPRAAPRPQGPALDEGGGDEARFRGAINLEGGALIIPDIITLGFAGASGQLGVQINDLVGIYAIPQLDVVFGDLGGVKLDAALVVDFTIDNIVSFGAGPEAMVFAAIGADSTGASAAGGAYYGARLHGAVYPALGRTQDGNARKAFAVGFDLSIMGGGGGEATAGPGGPTASASNFIIVPQISVGYQAF